MQERARFHRFAGKRGFAGAALLRSRFDLCFQLRAQRRDRFFELGGRVGVVVFPFPFAAICSSDCRSSSWTSSPITLRPNENFGFCERTAASAAGSPPQVSFPSLMRINPQKASFFASSVPRSSTNRQSACSPHIELADQPRQFSLAAGVEFAQRAEDLDIAA